MAVVLRSRNYLKAIGDIELTETEGLYLQSKLFRSKSFKSLTSADINIFFDFALKSNKSESKEISFTYKEIENLEFTQNTFFRARNKFIKVGLIDLLKIDNESGYNVYKLSNRWKAYGTALFIEKNKLPVQQGYVYLIKSQDCFKIGIAKHIKNRVSEYVTENPFPTELILQHKVKDYLNKEQYLLNKFKAKNLHGEWFKLNETDIKYISDYLKFD